MIIKAGDITIHTEPVRVTARTLRSAAEREAVGRLIERIFGPEVRYLHRDDGSPYIDGFDGHISVSHGAGLAVVAVGRRPLGVDVECQRPQLARTAGKFLDSDEQRRFATPGALLRAWTAKEAAFKASGVGGLTVGAIRLPDESIAVLPDGRRLSVAYFGDDSALIALATF